jgi:hypothetical protein
LQLSPAEELVVMEVSRQGRCSYAHLQAELGQKIPDLERVLETMLAKTFLVAVPTSNLPVYVLSFVLQPPRPISPELAHEINNRVNSEGGVTEAYVKYIYESLGEQGLAVIEKVMAEQGQRYSVNLAEVRGGNPQVVGRRFLELMQVNGVELKILSSDETQLTYRQHVCPYKLGPGQQKLCDAVNNFDRALLKALGCSIRYTRRLVEGDSYCQAVIEKAEHN